MRSLSILIPILAQPALAQQAVSSALLPQDEATTDEATVPLHDTQPQDAGSYARGQVGLGIFETPSQSPLQLPRVGIRPRIPSTLRKGQWQLGWRETLVNMWAQEDSDPEFRLDYGSLYSALVVGYGVSDSMQIELEYHNQARFDSILDPVTEAFHDLFGLDDSGRDDFDDHDNAIEFPDLGIDIDESGSIRDNLVLTFQHTFHEGQGSWPTLSWYASYRENLYTNSQAAGEESNSFAVGIGGAKRFNERNYGYFSLGYVFHEDDDFEGINVELEDKQLSILLAYECRYRPDAAFVAQYLYTGESASDLDPFDKASNEFVFGWKKQLNRQTLLEVGLIENAIVEDNSPDFGIHFGLTWRL